MINTKIDSSTPKDKTGEVIRLLEDGVRSVFESGRYTDYLKTMSKFTKYSPNNSILIFMQRPEAVRVAGIQTWNRLGRSVMKGEKGIAILAPSKCQRTIREDLVDVDGNPVIDPTTGKRQQRTLYLRATFYKVVYVFDVSQTEGKPLPEFADDLKADTPGCEALFIAARHAATCPLDLRPMSGDVKGFYSPAEHRIVVKAGMSPLMSLKVAVHEIVHSRLDRVSAPFGGSDTERNDRETIAEGVAFVVLSAFGVDTSSYSFDYVASWSTGKELKELHASLFTIQKEAVALIEAIETELTT